MEDLPYFIINFRERDLLEIFTQEDAVATASEAEHSVRRLLPSNLETSETYSDLKQLVLRHCNMTKVDSDSESGSDIDTKIFWYARMVYGTHDDVRLVENHAERNYETWSVEGLIRKINIKSRTWDGRHIIQGLQFFMENGETKSVGMEMNDLNRVETLEVPPGQHIRDFIIEGSFYITSIGFETNQGQIIGPIGGNGGLFRPISLGRKLDKNYFYYIDGIRGKMVTVQGEKCICEIEFKYVCIPLDESFEGPQRFNV